MKVNVKKFQLNFPGDCYYLDKLISKENINPHSIVAIISKTTGNGELNDYSRQFAEINYVNYFEKRFNLLKKTIEEQIVFITSSGSEGIVTPHGYLIYNSNVPKNVKQNTKIENHFNQNKGLVAGIAKSRKILPEEIGTVKQISIIANTTREALSNSRIGGIEDVSVVFVKSPVISAVNSKATAYNPKESISLTRSASALGVGLALGEIKESNIRPDIIGKNMDIYSSKAFVFSGNEVDHCRIMIFGNAKEGNQQFFIDSTKIFDLMDIERVLKFFQKNKSHSRVATFAKFSIDPTGILRSQKIPVYNNDIRIDRIIRSVASGILVPILKDTEIFISSGGEHQGPKGGGLLISIFKKNELEGKIDENR